MATRFEPPSRYDHVAAVVNDNIYVWGGWTPDFPRDKPCGSVEKADYLSKIEVLDLNTGVWGSLKTSGSPPLGVVGAAWTVQGNKIIHFGGYCGMCYHNGIYQFNISTFEWECLMPDDSPSSPMRKAHCGIVSYNEREMNFCIVGGYGAGSQTSTAQYVEGLIDRISTTNEVHVFKSSSSDMQWFSPIVNGTAPPPCQSFSFTKLDDKNAFLYGGYAPEHGQIKDVYTINFVSWCWTKVPMDNTIEKPLGRDGHSCCLLSDSCQVALVMGGNNGRNPTLDDVWVMDLKKGTWKKISISDSYICRYGHTCTPVIITQSEIIVVLFGGQRKKTGKGPSEMVKETYTLTLVLESHGSSSEWTVKNDPISEKLEMLKLKVKEKKFTNEINYEKSKTKNLHKQISKLKQQPRLLSGDASLSVKPEKADKGTQCNSDDFKEGLKLTALLSDNNTSLQEQLTLHNDIKVKEYQEIKTIEQHTKMFKETIKTSGKAKNKTGQLVVLNEESFHSKFGNITFKGLTIEATETTMLQYLIRLVWSEEFMFPDNYELLSSVYSVDTFEESSEPVNVFVKHCGVISNDNQCSEMFFAICTDPEYGPPYNFKIIDGHFEVKSNIGHLCLKFSFKLIAVVCRVLGIPINSLYISKWYIEPITKIKSKGHLVFTRNLEANLEAIDNFYLEKVQMRSGHCINDLVFKEEKLYIMLVKQNENEKSCFEYEIDQDGWKVTLSVLPPVVRKKAINELAKTNQYIPVVYYIEKTKANLTNQLHFQLSGTEDDMSFALNDNDVFITEIHTQRQNAINRVAQQIPDHNDVSIFKCPCLVNCNVLIIFTLSIISLLFYGIGYKSSKDSCHNIKGESLVIEEKLLYDFPVQTISQPYLFCFCLRIPPVECQKIQREHLKDTDYQVIDIIMKWYHMSIFPSWESMVEALVCSKNVREARKLAKKHNIDINPIIDRWKHHTI